jgi:hypothetical protein
MARGTCTINCITNEIEIVPTLQTLRTSVVDIPSHVQLLNSSLGISIIIQHRRDTTAGWQSIIATEAEAIACYLFKVHFYCGSSIWCGVAWPIMSCHVVAWRGVAWQVSCLVSRVSCLVVVVVTVLAVLNPLSRVWVGMYISVAAPAPAPAPHHRRLLPCLHHTIHNLDYSNCRE